MKYTFARISALLQFSTLLSVLCASLGLYLLINTAMEYYQSQNKSLKANNIATHIESKISQYQTQLRLIAMQPDIITVLRDSEETRKKKQASLEKGISSASKLRLLPPDTNAIDTSEVPNMGYACLGMIRQSAKGPGPQNAEVHMLDTPSSHIAVIQSVWDQNNELAGYILLSLKPELIQEILNQHPHQEGYLELRQKLSNDKSIAVATYGKPVVNTNDVPAEQVPVVRTNWTLSYWQDIEPWTLSSDMRPIFVYFGLSALFLLLGPLLVHNLMRRTVQHDIKILTTMLNDIRTGRIAPDYPIKLKELSLIAIQLQRSGGKLVQDQQALIKKGHTDKLTGLADMTVFNLKLDQLFDHTKLGFPSTVMIVDIDHLLQINDKYEHEGGDKVLKAFAKELSSTMRQVDYVCKLEEDKFGVIFSLTTLSDVAPAIERLKGKIPFKVNIFAGKSVNIGWSGGVSAMQASDKNAMAVIQRAESALNESKKAGGNQISISATPAPQKAGSTVTSESSQNNSGGQTHGSKEKSKAETEGKENTGKEKSAKEEKNQD